MSTYYVYVHYRGPHGDPFYVGKGKGKRELVHERDALKGIDGKNSYKARTIRKVHKRYGCVPKERVTVVGGIRDEDHAYYIEHIVIRALRMSGARLTNLNDGGLGGVNLSEEVRAKIGAKSKGRPHLSQIKREARVCAEPTCGKVFHVRPSSKVKYCTPTCYLY